MVDVEGRQQELLEIAQREKRVLAGRYRLDSKIAEGGFGVIYKATQLQLNRLVAVKIISADSDEGNSEDAKRRFMLEAATLAKLVHTNVVTIHDYGQTEEGDLFIVMEYLDGHSLDEVIQREGPLPFRRLVRIAVQIARALRQAHAAAVVHRDLKPANVMLVRGADDSDWDHVKVLDFGLVKLMETGAGKSIEVTQSTSLLGTPKYMSPEQICGEQTDGRADMYSFGCILYHLVTGSAPFSGDTKFEVVQSHLTRTPLPSSEVGYRRSCPRGLEAVINRCLEKVPDHRYSSMGEVIEALKGVYGRLPVEGSLRGELGGDSNDLSGSISELSDSNITDSGNLGRRMVSTAGPSFPVAAEPVVAPPAPKEPRRWTTPILSAVTGAAVMGMFLVARAPQQAAPIAQPLPAAQPSVVAPTETKVMIKSTPSGAKVSQEGVVVGVTPFILTFPLDESVRRFKLELKGHQTVEVQVRMNEPQIDIEAELEKLTPRQIAAPPPPKVIRHAVRAKKEAPLPREPEPAIEQPSSEPIEPIEELGPPVPPPVIAEPDPVLPREIESLRAKEQEPEVLPEPKTAEVSNPVITPPKRKRKMAQPEYPQRYRSMELEGEVVAKVFVDPQGEVYKVEIAKSSGHSELDQSVRKAAKKDRFEPAVRNGLPVPYELTVKYVFRLTDDR